MTLDATGILQNGMQLMTPFIQPDDFDPLLDRTLLERSRAELPAGFAQRMMAHVTIADEAASQAAARLFSTADRVNTTRSARSLWTAITLHAAVFVVIIAVAAQQLHNTAAPKLEALTTLVVPPPPSVIAAKVGGGGGQVGPTPVTQGHLPKLAAEQLLPPKAPPLDTPKLQIEPSVVVQDNLKMADNKMPDLGAPNSNLKGFSMGNGNGSGIGSGDGGGIGPGSGTNIGGGPMHIGGMVKSPSVLSSVDAEFSEEARKAKFSGNVLVGLWVDAQGNPSHIHVVRGVGMGLDEKAIAAVRQYKFRPATLNGKPVQVDLNIEVNFQIF